MLLVLFSFRTQVLMQVAGPSFVAKAWTRKSPRSSSAFTSLSKLTQETSHWLVSRVLVGTGRSVLAKDSCLEAVGDVLCAAVERVSARQRDFQIYNCMPPPPPLSRDYMIVLHTPCETNKTLTGLLSGKRRRCTAMTSPSLCHSALCISHLLLVAVSTYLSRTRRQRSTHSHGRTETSCHVEERQSEDGFGGFLGHQGRGSFPAGQGAYSSVWTRSEQRVSAVTERPERRHAC